MDKEYVFLTNISELEKDTTSDLLKEAGIPFETKDSIDNDVARSAAAAANYGALGVQMRLYVPVDKIKQAMEVLSLDKAPAEVLARKKHPIAKIVIAIYLILFVIVTAAVLYFSFLN